MATTKKIPLEMQDILVNYFKLYHFNKMSANVRAKFGEHVEKDDLVGNMKDWKDNLWDKDAKKDPVALLEDITDDELIGLYKSIRSRLQRLPNNPAVYKDGKLNEKHDAVKFYQEYFGDGNMFHESSLAGNVKTTVEKLFASDDDDVKTALNQSLASLKKSENDSNPKYTLKELKDKVATEEYNKDPEFRNDLYQILYAVINNNRLAWSDDSDIKKLVYDLSDIVSNGFNPNPSQFEIDSFRAELPAILNQVYSKKKVRETIFSGSEIVSALDAAREKVDYDKADSECFIEGKTDDQLTIIQWLEKQVTDKYEDYLEKYLHGDDKFGDHLYRSREAKEIVAAIKKAGVKKTEGLDKVLEKASDIKAKAVGKMKKAGPQFDWIVKEFTKLKKDMPKAFAGCLNDGWQLSSIVQQLILDAIDADKLDEAETAMELLVVMQYGNLTSGLMEKIRGDKELFGLFSNEKLSWNKNEGTKFVTAALDKTLRIGTLAFGYGVTFAYNKMRQWGAKIGENSGNKFFQAEREKWEDNGELADDKEALKRATDRITKYAGTVGLTVTDPATLTVDDVNAYITATRGSAPDVDTFDQATEALKEAIIQRDRYDTRIKEFDIEKKNKFKRLCKCWNELVENNRLFGEQRNLIGSKENAQKTYFETVAARKAASK